MDGRSCRCGLPRPCRWDKWVRIPPAIARAPSSHTRQRTTRSRAVDTSACTSGVIMSTDHAPRDSPTASPPVSLSLPARRTSHAALAACLGRESRDSLLSFARATRSDICQKLAAAIMGSTCEAAEAAFPLARPPAWGVAQFGRRSSLLLWSSGACRVFG